MNLKTMKLKTKQSHRDRLIDGRTDEQADRQKADLNHYSRKTFIYVMYFSKFYYILVRIVRKISKFYLVTHKVFN